MTLCIPLRSAVLKAIFFLFFTLISPVAFAISDFVKTQSPQHVTALIYGLLGMMLILFITPLLQFYFGAVREASHKQALDEQARTLHQDGALTASGFHAPGAPLQQLFDVAPVGMGKLNSKHEIVSANPGFIQRFGYTESELKKGNIYKLFSDAQQAERCEKTLHKHNELNKTHVELTNKAGEAFPAELTVVPTNASCEEYVFWLVNYSDEQFQYDKFNALLENTDAPVAILTEQGFSKLNRKAYKFLNITSDTDMHGLYPHSPSLNLNKENVDELATLIDTIREKGGIISIPWTHMINNTSVPCEITMVPVYKDHVLDSILCIWTDLREAHQAAEALKSATDRLERLQASDVEQQQHIASLEQDIATLNHTNAESDAIRAKLADTEHRLAEQHAQKQALEKELDALKSQIQSANNRTEFENTCENENAEDGLAQASSKITSLENLLSERDKRISVMTLQREAEERETSALLSQIDSLKQTLHQKTQKLELLEYQIDRLEAEQENATDFIRQLTKQLNMQGKTATSSAVTSNDESETVTQLRAKLNVLTTDSLQEKQRLLDAKDKADAQLVSAKAALSKTQQDVSDLTLSRQQMEQENAQQADLIDDLMNQLAALRQEHKQQQTQLMQLQQAPRQEQQDTQNLQQALDSQHDAALAVRAELNDVRNELSVIKQAFADKEQQQRHAEARLAEQINKEQDYLGKLKAAREAQSKLQEKLQRLEKLAHQNASTGTPGYSAIIASRPDIESIVLPNKPVSWFDLNRFWSSQPSDFRLSLSLSALLDEIDDVLHRGEAAVQSEKMAEISTIAQHLLKVSKSVNAEQLTELAKSFTRDCRLGMKDNALVRWQPTKQALQKSQRVVYEQLQHV